MLHHAMLWAVLATWGSAGVAKADRGMSIQHGVFGVHAKHWHTYGLEVSDCRQALLASHICSVTVGMNDSTDSATVSPALHVTEQVLS